MSDNVVPLRAKPKTAQELLAELAADPGIKGVLVAIHYSDDKADVKWSGMPIRDAVFLGHCLAIEMQDVLRGTGENHIRMQVHRGSRSGLASTRREVRAYGGD